MTSKTSLDIERLLQWAYRDELSKRQTSAAEGVWDAIRDYGQRGGIDPGHGAAQRYSHFGLPDPDALAIEKAVNKLQGVTVDWPRSLDAIAGDLTGLVTINDLAPKGTTPPSRKAGWEAAGARALRAFFGPDGVAPEEDRRRDVLMVGTFQPAVLVTSHAIRGTRPDWWDDSPAPHPTSASKGPGPKVVGTCEGKNRYSLGSHGPLTWQPSPTSIILARADYVVWWEALNGLASSLDLQRYVVLPPAAPPLPWFENTEIGSVINLPADATATSLLPLTPARGRTLGPLPRPKAGPVRHIVKLEASE